MGAEGVLLVDAGQSAHIPAMQVKAVDTTEAGDAFAAALTVFCCEGYSMREAAERANVVGALTVGRMGTHAAFPTLQIVLQAYASR